MRSSLLSSPSKCINQNSSAEAPMWAPDGSSKKCMLCNEEFNFFTRKHHCRACGKVLCSKCASILFLPSFSFDLSLTTLKQKIANRVHQKQNRRASMHSVLPRKEINAGIIAKRNSRQLIKDVARCVKERTAN